MHARRAFGSDRNYANLFAQAKGVPPLSGAHHEPGHGQSSSLMATRQSKPANSGKA